MSPVLADSSITFSILLEGEGDGYTICQVQLRAVVSHLAMVPEEAEVLDEEKLCVAFPLVFEYSHDHMAKNQAPPQS
jgi:hypothetical protein